MPLYGAGGYLSLAGGGTVVGATTFSATTTFSNDLNFGGGSGLTWSANTVLKGNGNGLLRWTRNDGTISTVATLPTATAGLDGARSFVTDATVTTFASTVVGGGSNHVPVYCDGSGTPAWKIG